MSSAPSFPGADWQSLVFSGGLSQKIDLLRTLIADRFKVGYRLSPHSEDTLLGLLVLGTAFTGRANSVQHASQIVRETLAENSLNETRD